MLVKFEWKKPSAIMIISGSLLLSGCGGLFGSANQTTGNYNNWVADYSTRGAPAGGTPLASAQPSVNAPATTYQPATLVTPVNQPAGQPLDSSGPVIEPLQSEVIIEPITIEPIAAMTPAVTVSQPAVAVTPVPAVTPVSNLPSIDKGTATNAKGNWRWPVDGGKLFRAYNPGSTGSKGALISGKLGAAVRAANSGKVIYVGRDLPGLGTLIIISHAGNVASGYGHVNSIAVKEGDKVKQGQAIAKLEGINSKEPVIHFEVRQNNQPTNPISYLQPK